MWKLLYLFPPPRWKECCEYQRNSKRRGGERRGLAHDGNHAESTIIVEVVEARALTVMMNWNPGLYEQRLGRLVGPSAGKLKLSIKLILLKSAFRYYATGFLPG